MVGIALMSEDGEIRRVPATLPEILLIPRNEIRSMLTDDREGQPRHHFDPVELRRLSDSILARGLLVPIIVTPVFGHPVFKWQLVAGERRWRAVAFFDPTYPMRAIVSVAETDVDRLEESLVENCNRLEMAPLESAYGMKRLINAGRSRAYIATLFGKSLTYVSLHLSLLKLSPQVQRLMDPALPTQQQLAFMKAVMIAQEVPDDPKLQLEMANAVVSGGMVLAKARMFVRDTAVARGIAVELRRRSPSEELSSMHAILQRIAIDAISIKNKGRDKERLRAMLAGLRPDERASLLESLEETGLKVQDALGTLREALKQSNKRPALLVQ